MAATSVLAKLAVLISANTAEFNKSLSDSRKSLSAFQNNIKSIAGSLGVAFGVKEVADFALEVSKLAGEADGVSKAFNKLPDNIKLMKDLKDATGGTVSELDLMKRAVQSSNFDISLKALPDLLRFATIRAQQTGQSVDYLVDSIVTGIGRKSKLILDNLGISAVQLNEKLKGVGIGEASVGQVAQAVGEIASEALKKSGELAENNSTKLQRLAASWDNVKVSIGNAANSTGVLAVATDSLTKLLDVASSKDLSFFEKIIAATAGYDGVRAAASLKAVRERINILEEEKKSRKNQKQVIEEVDRAFKEFNGNIDAYGEAIQQHVLKTELLAEFTKRLDAAEKERVITVGELRDKQKELNEMFEATDMADKKRQEAIGKNIQAINAQIEAIDALKKKQEGLPKFTRPEVGTPSEGDNPFAKFEEDFKSPLDLLNEDMTNQLKAQKESLDGVATSWYDIAMGIERANKSQDDANKKMQQSQQIGMQFGSTIGAAFGAAIAGQEDFGDAMKRLVPQLLSMFLSQAIGAQIAAGAEAGAQSGNPAVGFALAAAGAAAIGTLFASMTGFDGSKGGSGVSNSNQSTAYAYAPRTDRSELILGGEFTFKNGSLSLALSNENIRGKRTG